MSLEIIISKNNIEPTKANADKFAAQLLEQADDGRIDVIDVVKSLEFIATCCEVSRKVLGELLLTEISKHGKIYEVDSVKFEEKQLGVKYDFTMTKAWLELKAEEDNIAVKRKALETQLKAIKTVTQQLNEETGELMQLYPAVKSSTTGICITLPK